MVVEAVQNYVNLVNGLSKMTRDRALAVARALLAQAGLEDVANDAGERVSKLAEEILVASRANRELVENLVATEVDKAAGRWGFVRTDDVEALREEIAELREALARATVDAAAPPATKTAAKRTARRRPPAAPAGAPADQGPPLGGVPDQSPSEPVLEEMVPSEPLSYEPGPIRTNAERLSEAAQTEPSTGPTAPAKKSVKKAPARKAPAQKTTAQKTPARKTAAQKTSGGRPAPEETAEEVPATTTVAESLTPLSTFSPVTDADATE
jgi:hypothetical protein